MRQGGVAERSRPLISTTRLLLVLVSTVQHPLLNFLKTYSARKAIRLGDYHRDARRWPAAAGAYRQAVRIDPSMGGIWVQYGHALKEQGDLEGALGAYGKAQRNGLDDGDIHLQLGHVLKLQGRTKDAIAAYGEAIRRDRANADALFELQRLGASREDFRQLLNWQDESQSAAPDAGKSLARVLAVEISDVAYYVNQFRRPTGIQRVQLGVVRALLENPPSDAQVVLVAFSQSAQGWVKIDPATFLQIERGMAGTSGVDEAAWRKTIGSVTVQLVAGEEFEFENGSILLNIGSSWALPNYFLALRRLRAASDVAIVHFVHDCIPVIAPEYFVPGLQRDFREWIRGILRHCDGLVANSNSTAKDIVRVAEVLGEEAPRIGVAPLDAVSHIGEADEPGASEAGGSYLSKCGLTAGDFVLFVGTIEPRKNHVLAFEAWKRLIDERGAANTPQLVCVGGSGWRNAKIRSRLEENETPSSKVTMLQGVSDGELGQLYSGCRFSLYPSSYEGWGLPVTESLNAGKVALVARASSLPEAGGEFAEYFELGDGDDFLEKLERLIDDDDYLAKREGEIAEGFRPRSWSDVAEQIVSHALAARPAAFKSGAPQTLPGATFIRFAREPSGAAASGVFSGEGFRAGVGWGDHDERCAWFSGRGAATLLARLPREVQEDEAGCRIYMLVRGGDEPRLKSEMEERSEIATLGLSVHCGGRTFGPYLIEAGGERWLEIALDSEAMQPSDLHIELEARSVEDEVLGAGAAGVVGLYVHGANDALGAQDFLAGVALNAVRYAQSPMRLVHKELGAGEPARESAGGDNLSDAARSQQ